MKLFKLPAKKAKTHKTICLIAGSFIRFHSTPFLKYCILTKKRII